MKTTSKMNREILAIACFFMLILTFEVKSQDITSGLVGHWTFDNISAADVSGNNRNGTIMGATLAVDKEGKHDGALYFDGVDDYVDLSAHNSYYSTLSTGTISLWFKAPVGNYNGTFIGIGNELDNYASFFSGGNSISCLSGESIGMVSRTSANYNYLGAIPAGDFFYNDNAWHHLVITVSDNSNTVYVDGTQQSMTYCFGNANVGSKFLNVTSGSMGVGRRFYPNSPSYFKGAIDDIKIYDRPLSSADVSALNIAPVSTSVNPHVEPVAHWPFDGNANDINQEAHHGTLNGGASYVIDKEGKENSALYLDGIDDYVDLSAHDAYFKTLTAGTISLWFKASNVNNSGILLSLGDTEDNYFSLIVGGDFSSHIQDESFGISIRKNSVFDILSYVVNEDFFYNDNQWHHMAFTVSSSANSLYVDGTKKSLTYTYGDENQGHNFLNAGLSKLAIGRAFRLNPDFFNGVIDDVKIYDRAISASEVLEIYNTPVSESNTGQSDEGLFAEIIGVGTEEVPVGYRLSVKGKIITEGVKVALSADWPDYVFETDYKLMPIVKVKEYVEKNKHLPNVPSALALKESGVDLLEMNSKLMEKIEELTLYLIEQNTKIEELQETVKTLQK